MHESDGPSRYAVATYPLPLQTLKDYSKSVELGNDLSGTVCRMRFRLHTTCLRYFCSAPPFMWLYEDTVQVLRSRPM